MKVAIRGSEFSKSVLNSIIGGKQRIRQILRIVRLPADGNREMTLVDGLTDDTSCLRDLLEKGEQCRKVVRTKYVDAIAAQIVAGAPSLTSLDVSDTNVVGPSMMPAAK